METAMGAVFFLRNSLPTVWLRDKIVGPVTPKWVNIISPNILACTFSLDTIDTSTLRRLRPIISFTQDSSVTMGTSDGRISVILWPTPSAKRYPSPVDPVNGYDAPPVAMMTASQA